MSPASSPRRGPARRRVGMEPGGARRGAFGIQPGRQQRADDPGEHVAGAGGRQPLVAVIDHEHVARGAATTVVGPLSNTTTWRSAASAPAHQRPGRLPVRGRRAAANSPSCGVITVGRPRWRNSGPAPSALHAAAKMPSPSMTTGSVASPISGTGGRDRALGAAEARTDHERTEPVEIAEHVVVEVGRRDAAAG